MAGKSSVRAAVAAGVAVGVMALGHATAAAEIGQVARIDNGGASSAPFSIVAAGGGAYFLAEDTTHGRELWKTTGADGCSATALVKDLVPGSNGTDFVDLEDGGMVALGDKLVFVADTGSGEGVYATDGTAAGTVLLSGAGTDPGRLVRMGNRVYFSLDDAASGKELWATDGTQGGTAMLEDTNPGASHGGGEALAVVGGDTLFFYANDGVHGTELWRTDGVAGHATLIDFEPGGGSLPVNTAVGLDDVLIFTGVANGDTELFVSDGTVAGTGVIEDSTPIPGQSSEPRDLVVGGDDAYYTASDGATGRRELFRTDGTVLGTVQLTDAATDAINIDRITPADGRVFFVAENGDGSEPWVTDGTSGGTHQIADLEPGPGSSLVEAFTTVGGIAYFANGATGEGELWRSDGTVAGTARVKDINPSDGSYPQSLARVGDAVLFSADDGTGGSELWRTDGTSAGTRLAADIDRAHESPSIQSLIDVGGTLFFTAEDRVHGRELWRSDGSEAGTQLVKDIAPGAHSSGPRTVTADGTTLYFAAEDATHGGELWKSDGTAAGTQLVKDIRPGAASSSVEGLAVVGGKLWFRADDGTNGSELWTSDGTEAGTQMVEDLVPGASSSYPESFVPFAGKTYFRARDGSNVEGLYSSDGTAAGTDLVKDPGGVGELVVVGSTLYFPGSETDGWELWASDGSEAGTVQTADLNPGGDAQPDRLTPMNGKLYFFADDGTVEGLYEASGATVSLVKEPLRTERFEYPRMGVFENRLYFGADGTGGTEFELWRSDGTPGGTAKPEDLNGDPAKGEDPFAFASFEGELWMLARARQFDSPAAVYRTDRGSDPDGTALVRDFGVDGSLEREIVVSGGEVYLVAGLDDADDLWSTSAVGRTFPAPDLTPVIGNCPAPDDDDDDPPAGGGGGGNPAPPSGANPPGGNPPTGGNTPRPPSTPVVNTAAIRAALGSLSSWKLTRTRLTFLQRFVTTGNASWKLTYAVPSKGSKAARTVTLGTARKKITKTGRTKVTIKLTSRGRKALKGKRRPKVKLTTTFKPTVGRTVKVAQTRRG